MLKERPTAIAIEKQTYFAIALALFLSIALIVTASIVAVGRQEPHDFGRSGSLLVIVSLGLVAYQFLYETSAERRRETIIRWLQLRNETSFQFAVDQAGDTEQQANHLIHGLIWRSRLAIVITSVGIGVVGEIIHGFGDLLFEFTCHALMCPQAAAVH